MRKQVIALLFVALCTSCMTNYPLTTFYVKNNTDQTVNFKATVVKQSSMGPFERTVPFTVPARDSVLARQTNFHSDAEPNQWFTDFTLFPIEGVFFNDPNKPESWIKSTDAKGRPVYTFTVSK